MKLGFDVDGIFADFVAGFNNHLIETSGRNLVPADFKDATEWNWSLGLGYTKEEVSTAWDAIKASNDFWVELPGFGDTFDVLKRIMELDHDVYFITHRMGQLPQLQTQVWLMGYGYEKPPSVLVSSHKGLSVKALELDAYIDDKPLNCWDVRETYPACKTFVMNRSWNARAEFTSEYSRVDSVHEMLDQLGV